MLRSLQLSVLTKIAKSNLEEFEDTRYLLESIINLGFTGNPNISHSLCSILNKVLTLESLQIFENEKNKNLRDLLVLLIQYWLSEQAEFDTHVL